MCKVEKTHGIKSFGHKMVILAEKMKQNICKTVQGCKIYGKHNTCKTQDLYSHMLWWGKKQVTERLLYNKQVTDPSTVHSQVPLLSFTSAPLLWCSKNKSADQFLGGWSVSLFLHMQYIGFLIMSRLFNHPSAVPRVGLTQKGKCYWP